MGTSYQSDLLGLVGTIFLWVLFPSYNAAFAPDTTQYRVVVNTVLSLCSSVMFGFVFSRVFRGGQFKMHDIQRSTLAGGIAMASISSFLISPGGAIVTGAVAGSVSTLTLVYVVPALEKKGMHDNFGTLGAWGVPGLIGAITGIISAGIATTQATIFGQSMQALFPDRGTSQAGWNLIALLITLGIAIIGGVVCGIVSKLFDSIIFASKQNIPFSDERDWIVPEDFEMTIINNQNSTNNKDNNTKE